MALRKMSFVINRTTLMGVHDSVLLTPDEAIDGETLGQQVLQTLSTELEITVGGTTMHVAGWMDPDHWAEDWREKLGVDLDDVYDAVQEILEANVEDYRPPSHVDAHADPAAETEETPATR